jgi:hypothetical protein
MVNKNKIEIIWLRLNIFFALSRGDVAMTGPVMWIPHMLRELVDAFLGGCKLEI